MTNAVNRGPNISTRRGANLKLGNKNVPWIKNEDNAFNVNLTPQTLPPVGFGEGPITRRLGFGPGMVGYEQGLGLSARAVSEGIIQINADPFLPMFFLFRVNDELPGIDHFFSGEGYTSREERNFPRSPGAQQRADTAFTGLILGNRNEAQDNPQIQVDSQQAAENNLFRRRKRITQLKSNIRKIAEAESNIQTTTGDETLFALWINPHTFQKQISKILSTVFTRGETYARHYWGDDQPVLSLSGTTPAYFTARHGLTRVNRADSTSFQNFLQFVSLYRDNTLRQSKTSFSVGTVFIIYDGRVYEGTFESLSFSEEADKPFVLDYQFSFVVRATYRQIESPESGRPVRSQAFAARGDGPPTLITPTQ
jgi:hypothetical protein